MGYSLSFSWFYCVNNSMVIDHSPSLMIPTMESCNVFALSATIMPSSCSPSNENGAGGSVISPKFTSSRLWAAAKLCKAFSWCTLFVSFWIMEMASSVWTPVDAMVRPPLVTRAVDVSDGEGVHTWCREKVDTVTWVHQGRRIFQIWLHISISFVVEAQRVMELKISTYEFLGVRNDNISQKDKLQ